jgi:hypothetical protein
MKSMLRKISSKVSETRESIRGETEDLETVKFSMLITTQAMRRILNLNPVRSRPLDIRIGNKMIIRIKIKI